MDHGLEIRSAIRDLKQVVRIASKEGYSYGQMSSDMGSSSGWNANNLKQFVARGGDARDSRKIRQLAATIVDYFENKSLNDHDLPRVVRIKSRLVTVDQENDLNREIGTVFYKIRKQSASISLPSRFAFIRFGRENKKIITILIEVKWSDIGYSFVMKMSSGKRVVIGDISHTIMNTYFNGLAFMVASSIGTEKFYELDVKDAVNRHQYLSSNPIGIETIAINNADLLQSSFTACFTGLDGSGKPVSGIGILVNEAEFEKFDIAETVFSSVECSDSNNKLKQILENNGASTVYSHHKEVY